MYPGVGTLPRKDKNMADLVVFLTALGMAIVAWMIRRALKENETTRR
jgi:hypothetical protein